MGIKDKATDHPSYGMVSVTRQQHQPMYLFGSPVKHYNSICLRITRATHYRNEELHTDRYHAGERYIEVEMTEQQFASLITTMNIGGGTPCTIRRLGGKSVEEPTFESPVDVFERELEKVGEKMIEEITALRQELAQAAEKPSKPQLRDIAHRLELAICAVSRNLPFLYKQYHEVLDSAARDAETALHGRVIGTFQQMGLDAFKEDATRLLGGVTPSTK